MNAMSISPSVAAASEASADSLEAVSVDAVDSLACVVLEPCSVLAAQPAITLSSMTTASAKQNNFFMFFIISYLICEIFFSCTRQHEISFLSQRRAVVKTIAALQKAKPLTFDSS